MEYTLIGRHGGASRVRKLMRLIQRTSGMRRFGKGAGFDLAIAHGSNDIAIASRLLGIPEANMHDYEFAVAQHHVGCRLAKRVIFPDSVPPGAPDAIRRRPGEALPVPRDQGGVLPLRLRARSGRPREARRRHRARRGRGSSAARRLALSPQVESPLPAGTRASRLRSGCPRGRPAAYRGAADLRQGARPAVPDRPGSCCRGTEPGGPRGPGRLGRGDDEPGGRRARDARLHDLWRAGSEGWTRR